MELHEIVKKLVGEIKPIGKSEVDTERLGNLMELCDLVDNLVGRIEDVALMNSYEHSVMEARGVAKRFLQNLENQLKD